MSTLVTILSGDQVTDSRTDINNNFSALNADKMETSVLDTDSTMAADSDLKVPSQKAVKAYIDNGGSAAFINSLFPTGVIFGYGGSTAPTNFLLCDGSPISRVTYALLYAVIGTTYGVGNGVSTFNLPDFRGRSILGAGTGTKVATFASRSSDTLTVTGPTNIANNEFQTGQAVTYHTTASVITGLTNDTVYYVIRTGNLTFKLASTLANAQNGTAISLSGDGTGTQTFTLTLTARTRGDTGGEENHAISSTETLAHTHTVTPGGTTTNGASSSIAANATATSNTGSFGGNAAMNNIAPFGVANYIIKYS